MSGSSGYSPRLSSGIGSDILIWKELRWPQWPVEQGEIGPGIEGFGLIEFVAQVFDDRVVRGVGLAV